MSDARPHDRLRCPSMIVLQNSREAPAAISNSGTTFIRDPFGHCIARTSPRELEHLVAEILPRDREPRKRGRRLTEPTGGETYSLPPQSVT